MNKHARIPALNDFRFIPANDSLEAGYHTWPFDRGFFEQHILNWQTDTAYQQKCNYGDSSQLYIDTLAPRVLLYALDEHGKNLIAPLNYTSAYTAAGNLSPSGTPYKTYANLFRLQDWYDMPYDRQIIYLVLETAYGPSDSVYFVSEPIYYSKSDWPDTVRLEYTQQENDFDVLFEQVAPVFHVRVEGALLDDDMTSHDTSFEDQQYLARNLQSVPGQLFKLFVGPLPPYIRDKVNRALSCKNFKVDQVQYVKDSGAKWSRNQADGYPMETASIILQPGKPFDGTSSTAGFTPLLALWTDDYDQPIFPCAINFLIMTDGFTSHNTGLAKVFEDMADLVNYMTQLNLAFVPVHGLGGTFEVVDGVIGYNNAAGENYAAGDGMFMFWAYIPFELYLGGGAGGSFSWQMSAANVGDVAIAIVDWGDGTVQVRGATHIITNSTHTYISGPLRSLMRLFHAGPIYSTESAIDRLQFAGYGTGMRVCGFPTGHPNAYAPVRLRTLIVTTQWFDLGTTEIDVSFLQYCRLYLQSIVFTNSRMGNPRNFTNNLLGTVTFPAINYINLSYNLFPTARINGIINSIYSHTTISPLKTILLQMQTPHAPPSGPAVGQVTTMNVFWGWTVVTD